MAQTLDREVGTVFVGREREFAALRAGLDDTLADHGRVLLLAGEPGIGKTRLASELAAEARQRGTQVLTGYCYEGEGAPPFWPWVQIVRACVTNCDHDLLRTEMGSGAADIAQVIPEVRERFPELPPPPELESEQARFRFFDSLTTFKGTAARERIRQAVAKNLRTSLTKIAKAHPTLGRHLRGAIKTGLFCSYTPEMPVRWEL